MPVPLLDSLQALSLQQRLPELETRLSAPERRISTGFPLLDSGLVDEPGLAGGLLIPSITVIGAEPKRGKSIFLQHIGEHHVTRGGWVFHLDFENGIERFLRRLLYRRARVTAKDFKVGLSRMQEERWNEALKWLHGSAGERYLFDHNRTLTPAVVTEKLGRVRKATDGPLLIIIDSLQKLPVNLSKDRRAQVDAWLRAAEEVRDTLDAAVILVSELKRASEGRQYKSDGVSYKESGDIEYTADLALSMSAISKGSPTSLLEVSWSRDGPVGPVARYELQRPYYTFVEKPLAGE